MNQNRLTNRNRMRAFDKVECASGNCKAASGRCVLTIADCKSATVKCNLTIGRCKPANGTLRCCFLPVMLIVLLGLSSVARADKGPYDWAFIRLDHARKEKVQQLRRFCDQVHQLTVRVGEDGVMVNFFDVNLKYFTMAQEKMPPEDFTKKITEFRKAFNDYYVKDWLAFYDILFIDKQGRIFYTIRKEPDFKQNMFEGDLSGTPLAQCLRKNPRKKSFIDFHYYVASDEPAAFFVEPVLRDGKHIGWIVLRLAINKINSLFAGAEQLGTTGEALLVNRKGYMLTESGFRGDSTILKMHLDDKNVETKFREKQGNKIVTDYRDFTVLTSFEVVNFLGTQWLVVTKVDESQIVTEHFRQHRKYYHEKVSEYLSENTQSHSDKSFEKGEKQMMVVDMDEFVKADHGELLQTIGVTTCTAVIATYPGKFGYMAHISPYDKIYGGSATNLLGHIIKKIKLYDIYKYERRRVHFIIVANHLDTIATIVDKLIEEDFLLSQIIVLHRRQARCANVIYDYSNDHTYVEWLPNQTSAGKIMQDAGDINSLEAVIKQYLDN